MLLADLKELPQDKFTAAWYALQAIALQASGCPVWQTPTGYLLGYSSRQPFGSWEVGNRIPQIYGDGSICRAQYYLDWLREKCSPAITLYPDRIVIKDHLTDVEADDFDLAVMLFVIKKGQS